MEDFQEIKHRLVVQLLPSQQQSVVVCVYMTLAVRWPAAVNNHYGVVYEENYQCAHLKQPTVKR